MKCKSVKIESIQFSHFPRKVYLCSQCLTCRMGSGLVFNSLSVE